MNSMSKTDTIPLVVGVTAHRAIRPEDRAALSAAVRSELEKLKSLCPNTRLVLLTSLAEGGDLLCADAAEELGIDIVAALPTPLEVFEKDFSPEALVRLRHHIEHAQSVFVTPFTEAVPENGPDRDFLFRQAGIYVAVHSHVLLALWDGGEGTAARCGTAEAVDFALKGDYAPEKGAPTRSKHNEAVIHVFTPRRDRLSEPAGTVHILGNTDEVKTILEKTDEYNCLAAELPEPKGRVLPEETNDPVLSRMEKIQLASGTLSRAGAKLYKRLLALLAVVSSLLTLAFLLYDEAEAICMIIVCGVLLLADFALAGYATRSGCHRRYIEYRALAEGMRVQCLLRYAGSRLNAAEELSYSQRYETAWIMTALYALDAAPGPETAHDIRECWVEKQKEYHVGTEKRDGAALQLSEKVVKAALCISITLYVAALIFEVFCGGLLRNPPFPAANAEIWRTWLKIILGTISAMTIFIANYYGKLSLSRKSADHAKMIRFYESMSDQLRLYGQSERLLAVLAEEELCENGNWYSYQEDNKPDIAI